MIPFPPPDQESLFPETAWSVLRPGSAASDDQRQAALRRLGEAYARPVQVWLRAAAHATSADSADLTQDFFLWIIESRFLEKADPARGRFRAFLKTALRNFMVDAARRERAQKRGGGVSVFPLASLKDAEHDRSLEPPADPRATPDQILDEAWRAAIVGAALARVDAEFAATGRARQVEVFREYFVTSPGEVDYATIAARHGVTKTDVSNWLTRVKDRYRTHLRQVVSETVVNEAELQDELRWLIGERAP